MTLEIAPPTAVPARARILRAVLVGVVAGFLSGLFGVGGGILIVPALVAVLRMDQRLAHGTSLAAVLPIAMSSTLGYALGDKLDWPVAALIAVGAVGGAVIGTHVLHVLPQRALAICFTVLLALTAVRLVLDHADAGGRADLGLAAAAGLLALGVASGVLAGLLGVGGGIVMVPAMVVLFHVPPAVAKGTSLAVIVPTSIMGTWRNRRNGNADLPVAVVVGLAGVVSAFAASQISIGMSETVSNVLFAVLLVVVAARMAWQLARTRAGDEAVPPAAGE
ncbi:MAG TPA: sulfite exporter TauE/SafE family protein [Acidimicrobiales bacterium]